MFLDHNAQVVRFNQLEDDVNRLVLSGFAETHEILIRARAELAHFKSIYLFPSPFLLNCSYTLMNGDVIDLVEIHNEGTSFETMVDRQGINRYTTRDFGRVTGSSGGDVARNIDLSYLDMTGYESPIWWKEVLNASVV